MNTKWTLITVGCLMGTLLLGQNQNPNLNPRQQALQQAYNSPIDFWGKVVDQDGSPIAGATAMFTIDSELGDDDNMPKVTGLSNADGRFSLTGKTGMGMVVHVSKDGYYSASEQSSANLSYALKAMKNMNSFRRGGTNEPFPTENNPTVFVLTKKGQPATNLVLKHIKVPMPKDGTPVNIDLAEGHVVAAGQGDLQVQSWVTDNGQDVVHPYPWKCRVTVLHGGLQPRSGELAFQAPSSGYQQQDEVNMPATATSWGRDMNRQYFLQISGNRYVRMRFWMGSGGHNFLNLDYYLNPQPGDQNLESAKQTPF